MSQKSVTTLLAVLVCMAQGPLLAQAWTNRRTPEITHHRRNAPTAPIVLSGQVVMEDGSPLGKMVQIELVCNGRLTQQTVTDPNGSFFLELGSPRAEDWLDPSMGGSADGTVESSTKIAPDNRPAKADEVPSMGQGRQSMMGCEVRSAPVAGFSSNRISLHSRSAFDNPDIGRIILRKMSDAEATTVSLKTLSAPDDARKAFRKANEELNQEQPNTRKAEKELQKAVEEYPEFSEAWDLLARVQMSRNDPVQAKASFLKAIEAEPKFLQPYMGLAQMAVQRSDWRETADWSSKVLALDSGYAPALYWNGLAGYYLGDYGKGVHSLSRLYELGHREEYPFGLLPLGVMHANRGQIQPAAEAFQLYLQNMPAEKVSESQRSGLERQLAEWTQAGLASLPTDPENETGTP